MGTTRLHAEMGVVRFKSCDGRLMEWQVFQTQHHLVDGELDQRGGSGNGNGDGTEIVMGIPSHPIKTI